MNKQELIDKIIELVCENAIEVNDSTLDFKLDQLFTEEVINFAHSSLTLPYKNEKLIENMCISYRHDFGLLDKGLQDHLRFECKEWLRAYENNK